MPKIYRESEISEFEHKTSPNTNEGYEKGIFSNNSNFSERFIADYDRLKEYVDSIKTLNLKIVLTSGSFDLTHIGHARYLEKAKSYGDLLIVGVDSDEKVSRRKGPERPIVPENERTEMLSHLRSADIITLKYPDEPKWGLIKLIRPDTLVVTEETYNEETLQELTKICGQVVCLEPQAETSTSAKIRKLEIDFTSRVIKPIEEVLIENGANEDLRRKIGNILLGGRDER